MKGTPKWKACTLQNVWDEIDVQTGSYTYDPENPDVPFVGTWTDIAVKEDVSMPCG